MKSKYFDLTQIYELSGGDASFKKELISIFLEQIPDFISNMKKFVGENDWENLAKEAHTAKSSALIFGMLSTGNNLKEVQSLAEAESTKLIPELVKLIETEMEVTAKHLKIIIKEL